MFESRICASKRSRIARDPISSTRRTRNSKKPSRTRVRSWKYQLLLPMPCRIVKKNCGSSGSNKNKTKLACILEADESMRLCMGILNHIITKTILQGKGENSLQHHNLVHKFIPMPQTMKIPAAKEAVDKEWGKIG